MRRRHPAPTPDTPSAAVSRDQADFALRVPGAATPCSPLPRCYAHQEKPNPDCAPAAPKMQTLTLPGALLGAQGRGHHPAPPRWRPPRQVVRRWQTASSSRRVSSRVHARKPFNFTPNFCPELTSYQSRPGSFAGGTVVTIKGHGFASGGVNSISSAHLHACIRPIWVRRTCR